MKEFEIKSGQFVFPFTPGTVDSATNWLINDLLPNPIVMLEIEKGEFAEENASGYTYLIDMTNLRECLQDWPIENRRSYQRGYLFGRKLIYETYGLLPREVPDVRDERVSYFKSLLVHPHRTIESDPDYDSLQWLSPHLASSVVSQQALSMLKRQGKLPDYICRRINSNSERKKTELFAAGTSLHAITPLLQGKLGMVHAEIFAYGVLDAYAPYQMHETVGQAAAILDKESF